MSDVPAPSRLLRALAIALALATSSGAPGAPWRPPLFADVPGVEALRHRPMLVMTYGGHNALPCVRGVPRGRLAQTEGRFALYEDGLVIFARTTDDGCEVMQAQLSPSEARARFEQLVDPRFSTLPHVRYVVDHAHASGAVLLVRRGTTWQRAAVGGVDRFGDFVLRDEPPEPAFVAMLRALATFDVEGAVPWVPEAYVLQFRDGVNYAPSEVEAARRPWPEWLPEPDFAPNEGFPERTYDASSWPRTKTLLGRCDRFFVVVRGKLWAVGVRPWVLPEQAYLDRVRAELDARVAPPSE